MWRISFSNATRVSEFSLLTAALFPVPLFLTGSDVLCFRILACNAFFN
uniref:Uncharacterized protein n=1 Tax=Arundo donax TaxID=35708 RepID=A0A0A9ARF8_ARUDO